MSFVERVVGHVRRVQRVADGTARDKRVLIDYARHEARWIEGLERVEQLELRRFESDLERWTTEIRRSWIEELHWMLVDGLGADLSLEARTQMVDRGLAMVTTGGTAVENGMSRVRAELLRKHVEEATASITERSRWVGLVVAPEWTDVLGYCHTLRLVHESEGEWSISEAGRTLLGLRGTTAAQWLLSLEILESLGPSDPWRVDRATLARVLEAHSETHYYANEGEVVGHSVAGRLAAMGMIELEEASQGHAWSLTPSGEEALVKVLEQDGAMAVVARAVLGGEVESLLGVEPRGPASGSGGVEATMRHARMVAHEVRNALGPIQHASGKLRSELAADGRMSIGEHLEVVEQGVNRLYRFVTELVRLVPPEGQSVEPFSVLEAIAEARKEMGPQTLGSLTIETLPVSGDPHCRGNRGQFVMAMVRCSQSSLGGAKFEIMLPAVRESP